MNEVERNNKRRASLASEFNQRAEEFSQWLRNNWHPHVTIIITPTSAELLEGEFAFDYTEQVPDPVESEDFELKPVEPENVPGFPSYDDWQGRPSFNDLRDDIFPENPDVVYAHTN